MRTKVNDKHVTWSVWPFPKDVCISSFGVARSIKTDHSVNAVAKLPFADKDSLESIDSVKDLLHVTFVKTYKINWHCKFSFSVGELAEKNPIISIYYNYQIFKVLYTTFCFQKYNILLMHLRRIKGSNCLICWLTNYMICLF